MSVLWLALPGLLIWCGIIVLPWRPWSTRETLDASPEDTADLAKVTVLIPARNEADVITRTLQGISAQGEIGGIILVDDQSSDDTAECARRVMGEKIRIIPGQPLVEGWSGKLWAMEQGRAHADTEYLLLLDADITLKPGILATLLNRAEQDRLDMLSLMAFLRMQSFWELLLMPAFIYFFKLLYPFALSNSSSRLIAAAAGGCILIKRQQLEDIGGFAALKNALIDDCSLARKVKQGGGRIWTGLTHSVISHRSYENLSTIWDMVARTAYTQLMHSISLLLLCTLVMLIAFVIPPVLLVVMDLPLMLIPLSAIILMVLSYYPVIRYYSLPPVLVLSLPLAAVFYLCMTWSSAIRHWQGTGAIWKNRAYVDPAL